MAYKIKHRKETGWGKPIWNAEDYKKSKMKTIAIYPTGNKYHITGSKTIEKPLMIYKEDGQIFLIKKIDFRETTASSNFADVEFYNKAGKYTINTNRIEEE